MRLTRKACFDIWEEGSIYAPGTGSSRSRETRQTNPHHARDARVSDIIRNTVIQKKTRLFTRQAADASFRNVQTHNTTEREEIMTSTQTHTESRCQKKSIITMHARYANKMSTSPSRIVSVC